jgi:hypothetical protein
VCFINPKHPSYPHKIAWLKERFDDGLVVKLLYLGEEKRPAGYIEYVPGERCWRSVDAAGYMFIHCIWIEAKKHRGQGWGTRLIREAENDAAGMSGVAVLVSDAAFMASRDLFVGNDYEVVAEYGADQLLAKRFTDDPAPRLRNEKNRAKDTAGDQNGLTILYSRQCPWVARFIDELKPVLVEEGREARITELRTPEEAQGAPSAYGVFNLLHNGKLLADRYISTTRFRNILRKEIPRAE